MSHRVELKDSVTHRRDAQLGNAIVACQAKLRRTTEEGAVTARERVGKVGEGAAVEGGIVAEGQWCMGG